MSLFNKLKQRITISSEAQSVLETFAAEISAKKLKNTKISAVSRASDQWQCILASKHAEALYYSEMLPLLYDSAETQSFQILLEFDDEAELVKNCPKELLISFGLSSRYAFGDEVEAHFIQKLHRSITHNPHIKPAAVCYYIVGASAVTMSVPCLDPEKMELYVRRELEAHEIKEFMIRHVDRERA